MNTMQALSKFNIEKKPEIFNRISKHGRFKELLVALGNLANDKCITMLVQEAEEMFGYKLPSQLQNMKTCLSQASKHAKIKAHCEISNGLVYFFTRS